MVLVIIGNTPIDVTTSCKPFLFGLCIQGGSQGIPLCPDGDTGPLSVFNPDLRVRGRLFSSSSAHNQCIFPIYQFIFLSEWDKLIRNAFLYTVL